MFCHVQSLSIFHLTGNMSVLLNGKNVVRLNTATAYRSNNHSCRRPRILSSLLATFLPKALYTRANVRDSPAKGNIKN